MSGSMPQIAPNSVPSGSEMGGAVPADTWMQKVASQGCDPPDVIHDAFSSM